MITSTSTASFFDRATGGMAALRQRAEALHQQIGSGERLARSSDDPLAAAQLRQLSRQDQLAGIDVGNARLVRTDLALADNALTSIADQLARVRELAVQAGNGTLNADQRSAIGTEILEIHQQIAGLANARDAAGHALFGGQSTGPAYTLDGAGNAVYAGTSSAGELALEEGQMIARGVTGPEVFGFTSGGAPTDLMASIKLLGEALQGAAADPAQAARDALGTLDTGLDTLSTAQTVIGSRMAWIDITLDRHTQRAETRAGRQAELGGADIAETISKLQQMMLVLEASQASFARLSGLSLFSQLR